MHEKGSPFPIADSQGRLECKDLWGGIRNRDIEVSAGKVIGSIYSEPCCEGGKGGDIYYFGVCPVTAKRFQKSASSSMTL
jgi:hypothetical protein